MDWLVFGDDWGTHVSTTQHLVRQFPRDDKVVWVNSLGGRTPRLCSNDLHRVSIRSATLLKRVLSRTVATSNGAQGRFNVITPTVLPYHLTKGVQWFNATQLSRAIRAQLNLMGMDSPVILASLPTVILYLDSLPHSSVAYLRLDEYRLLPGMDASLIERTESQMYDRANAIFGTAKALLPDAPWRAKSHYLPQGVDYRHFAQVDVTPPREQILGFFGLIAEWLDFQLIAEVAKRLPSWRLEFVGPIRQVPQYVHALDNIHFLPPVPYHTLPQMIGRWQAAWIPFRVTPLTKAVNPLKAREYLAAGIAAHCTPLPEAQALVPNVFITQDADEIAAWANDTHRTDSTDARLQRRYAVKQDDWAARADQLRQVLLQFEK